MSNAVDGQSRNSSSLAFGFAIPIIGLTLALILGMAISDLFGTLDIWAGVLIIGVIGVSLVFGGHFSALALSNATHSRGAARAASIFNLVVVAIWSYVTLILSIGQGTGAIMRLQDYGNGMAPMTVRQMTSTEFVDYLLPAVVEMILLIVVLYAFIILRSKGRKI